MSTDRWVKETPHSCGKGAIKTYYEWGDFEHSPSIVGKEECEYCRSKFLKESNERNKELENPTTVKQNESDKTVFGSHLLGVRIDKLRKEIEREYERVRILSSEREYKTGKAKNKQLKRLQNMGVVSEGLIKLITEYRKLVIEFNGNNKRRGVQ